MLKKIYTILFAAVLIAGCKKNPVNVGPPNEYSTSTYPSTIPQLQTVLVSCYANLRDQGIFGFHFFPKALSNSMHTVNSVYGADPSWNEMANTNLTIGNEYVGETWQALYTGIKNCNVVIYAAGVYGKTASSPDVASVNLILGQAYCLRGWYYMQLECLYGQSYMGAGGTNGTDMGVPIYTAVPASLAQTQVARSSVKDVWTLIEGDFKQAATLLKGQVWDAADVARVTQWTAEGLLGKAYVYTQDWADAKTVLLDVIQHSGKTLMPYSTYHDAFNGNNKFNSESLFELYIDPNPQGGYGIYSSAANSSTINGLIWAPFSLGGYLSDGKTLTDGTEANAQPVGYGNEFFHDKNVLRFGYSIGNYNLVANPNYNSALPASYKNPKLIMDPVYRQNALLVRTNQTADPRLYVNAMQPWIDSVKFNGVDEAPVSRPNIYGGNTNVYGWAIRKYAPITYNENSVTGDAWDYYILRLADVYLLYAEASIGSGDNTTGLQYLNMVKRRAYGYDINAASPIDYTSTTSKTSAINDPVLGNNPLYYERWAELFNEGSWWFDVCRWRIGKSEAAYYGTAANLNGPIAWDDSKSYVWPVPLSEINTNSKIKQNPGY